MGIQGKKSGSRGRSLLFFSFTCSVGFIYSDNSIFLTLCVSQAPLKQCPGQRSSLMFGPELSKPWCQQGRGCWVSVSSKKTQSFCFCYFYLKRNFWMGKKELTWYNSKLYILNNGNFIFKILITLFQLELATEHKGCIITLLNTLNNLWIRYIDSAYLQ